MLHISDDGSIQLTRGDTAYLHVDIQNESTGTPYVMNPQDVLKFTVKASVDDTTALITKTATGVSDIKLLPTDTSSLDFDSYVYDAQLTTSTGDVFTVIGPKTFEVLSEVSS